MSSLYEQLTDKMASNPTARTGGPKADVAVLLFNYRATIRELWLASDEASRQSSVPSRLREAVDALRPLFGEPTS